MTFSEASHDERDLTRTVSGRVIKPAIPTGMRPGRPFNLQMDSTAVVVDAAGPADIAAVSPYPVAQQSVPLAREP